MIVFFQNAEGCDSLTFRHLLFPPPIFIPMIIGEIRRYLRDNNSIRVSRSLRDVAYKTITAREMMTRKNLKEPTLFEVAEEIGIEPETVTRAMDAIQSPVSLYEPVYADGGDAVCVMDQIRDDHSSDEGWLQQLALKDAISHLQPRERNILALRFCQGKTQMEVSSEIGISQAQVSRLEKNAIRSIKQEL